MSETRALVLGAETAAGRSLATALADAGARLAVVAATNDPQVAFDVQRLARRIGAAAQAIDATNEMAVRVMTRQVAKELDGLDLLVFSAEMGEATGAALALAARRAAREMARSGGGTILVASRDAADDEVAALAGEHEAQGMRVVRLDVPAEPDEAWAQAALDDYSKEEGHGRPRLP